METKPIIELLIENRENGGLKEGFQLPDENPENEIKWVDGALDGVYVYHMAHEPVTDEQRETMNQIFQLVTQDKEDEAAAVLAELSNELKATAAIDALQDVLITGQDSYDSEKIFQFGLRLFGGACVKELVKYGLSILEVFDTEQLSDEFKDVIRLVALCEEFTLFAIFIILHWGNANQLLFDIGRRVHGWGRIHVVEYITPETEEIRQWLLHDGINNDVLTAYSALTCYAKAGVPELLESWMRADEFHSVGRILQAMLDEGPVPGISRVENHEAVLSRYLDRCKEYALTLEDYSVIEDIMGYASDEESAYPELAEKCSALLQARETGNEG